MSRERKPIRRRTPRLRRSIPEQQSQEPKPQEPNTFGIKDRHWDRVGFGIGAIGIGSGLILANMGMPDLGIVNLATGTMVEAVAGWQITKRWAASNLTSGASLERSHRINTVYTQPSGFHPSEGIDFSGLFPSPNDKLE